jgi:D-alanyl-D-alanine carboxypeptidase/D-alanyl-D-alanine-endopeptidase (penicillin-binding protein 4)
MILKYAVEKVRSMKVIRNLFMFCLWILYSKLSVAETLPQEIKSILAGYKDKVSLSIRNPDGVEVLSLNSARPMAPASVAKSVSTACSLSTLGPSFQFETVFAYRGQVSGDVLKGDLIISGNGDPSLVTENLREIIEKIRVLYGIKTIQGDLIFDTSYFNSDGLSMAEGFEGDAGRSFTALLTPFPMNQNSFAFWAAPDLGTGNKARVAILPANVLEIRIANQVREGGSTQLSVAYQPQAKSATVSGTVDKDGDIKGVYRAAPEPYSYYFSLIQKLWKETGGEWSKGTYKIQRSVQGKKILVKHQSKNLSQILMDINKFSLNLGAELVFLAAGQKGMALPANYDKSKAMLERCFNTYDIGSDGIELTNASGLARDSKIKTSALTKFLSQYHNSQFSSEYLASLSILGIDGTAKSRLTEYAGRGRVKTGTLKDVRSIAGYLYDQKHRPYTFAMFFNGISMSDPKVKNTEDQVMARMFQKNFEFEK